MVQVPHQQLLCYHVNSNPPPYEHTTLTPTQSSIALKPPRYRTSFIFLSKSNLGSTSKLSQLLQQIIADSLYLGILYLVAEFFSHVLARQQSRENPISRDLSLMSTVSFSILTPSKPIASSTTHEEEEEEHDPSNPSTALLSSNNTTIDHSSIPSPPPPQNITISTILFISLIIITCISLAISIAFAFLFFSSSPPHSPKLKSARPLTKLSRPVVLLISSDGFRFGYQFKTPTPNIHRLIANGTEAELGLIPVFPTLTFPNHYSIVTGLYPAYHGIINNFFVDPKITGEFFSMGRSHEPKWWLGEPLWETVVNHGFKAAVNFWPGSEVKKGSWNCSVNFCSPHYNSSVSFEQRVDTVLGYFDVPNVDEIPVFITLYFEDPDHQGHHVGPDDPEITKAIARIDRMIGRLIQGLEMRGFLEDVSIIMVGDHGMVGTCDKKLIFLEDLAPRWIEIPAAWVQSYSPLLSIYPPPGISTSEVAAKMNEGLRSGNVENGMNLRVFLKEDLPARLHYAESDRIPPIIGLLEEGFKVEQKRSKRKECGGSHGYDNAFFSMRSIFIGHGPQFERGVKVPSFENIEIYNMVTSILKIQGAPNNGSKSFSKSILLPN